MSMRMYVYNMGIVDYYHGMMPLLDYINLCPTKGDLGTSNYLTHKELKKFLLNCFMEAKISADPTWDGDIRGLNEIAISAIPRPTGMLPWKMLVFKQDNNGESFLISECKLHIDEDDTKDGVKMAHFSNKNINYTVDYRDLTLIFFKCVDLIEELFDEAELKKEKFNENKNFKLIENNKIDKEKTEEKNDKFNLKNYEKLN